MTPETSTPIPDLINLLEWNRFAEQGMTLLEALTILNNRHRAEIDAMREALREAHDAFVDLAEYWNKDQNENAMADACWHTVETSSDALAKLEPFIKP